MQYDYEHLSNALKKAAEAAAQFANEEDTGTFNTDTPYIVLHGADTEEVFSAAATAGIRLYKSFLFADEYNVYVTRGNRSRRTKEAEAVVQSLKDSGYTAYVFYMVD